MTSDNLPIRCCERISSEESVHILLSQPIFITIKLIRMRIRWRLKDFGIGLGLNGFCGFGLKL